MMFTELQINTYTCYFGLANGFIAITEAQKFSNFPYNIKFELHPIFYVCLKYTYSKTMVWWKKWQKMPLLLSE